jgi:hypothetical protein
VVKKEKGKAMTIDEAIQRVNAISMSGDKRVLLNGVVSAGRVLANEVERLRRQLTESQAEVALFQHQLECWAYGVGGVPCKMCDTLEDALEAAKEKP